LQEIGVPSNAVKLEIHGSWLHEPKNDKDLAFAKLISKGHVELLGLLRDREIWRTELNYGDYWPVFERQKEISYTPPPEPGDNKHEKSNQHGLIANDVRDMRQIAIRHPDKAKSIVVFLNWLQNRGLHPIFIPEWCQKLAEKLSERSEK
jgi:hypothetical protein